MKKFCDITSNTSWKLINEHKKMITLTIKEFDS